MLNIRKFILDHPDSWETDLMSPPYSLKIKRSPFADGRYVMDSRLLKRIQPIDMTGVERISRNEALTLIAQGGFDSDSNKPKE